MLKVGDEVICVEEAILPHFVGTRWVIIEILKNLYLCEAISRVKFLEDLYPFREGEIAEVTPLLEALYED